MRFIVKVFVCSLVVLVTFSGSHLLRGQGFVFSNGFESPLYLNPAFAGTADAPQLATQFRRPTTGVGFFHYVASFDMPVEKLRGGIGFSLSSTIMEEVRFDNLLNGFYAWHWNIGTDLLVSPAVNIGFGYNHLNNENLSLGGVGEGRVSAIYFNVGGGLMMRYRNLTTGFSIDHLNTPDVGYNGISETMPQRLTVHGVVEHALMEQLHILPGIIYQSHWDVQHVIPSVVLDFMGFRAGINGVYERNRRGSIDTNMYGVCFLVGAHLQQFMIGYSYTTGVSEGALPNMTAHELAITYRFSGQD